MDGIMLVATARLFIIKTEIITQKQAYFAPVHLCFVFKLLNHCIAPLPRNI
jgi:hypothetical protein